MRNNCKFLQSRIITIFVFNLGHFLFELCKSTYGEDILKSFFENIISSNLVYLILPILALEAHKPTQVSRAHFSRTIPFRENS
jgi:hypothetical protein